MFAVAHPSFPWLPLTSVSISFYHKNILNNACPVFYHFNLLACNVCSEKWRLRPEARSAQNCTASVGLSLNFCATPAHYVSEVVCNLWDLRGIFKTYSVCGCELQEIISNTHSLDLYSAASCSFHSFTRSAHNVEGFHLALSPVKAFPWLQHRSAALLLHDHSDLGWYWTLGQITLYKLHY